MSARIERRCVVRAGAASVVCHIRGRGPLCVAHPGGPGMHWEYLRMPLVERNLTMVYLEPVGTGASSRMPAGARAGLATYAEHVDAVVREIADGPVFLLGHAHGGFVAQRYVVQSPERVAGLILYATAAVANAQTRAAARENLRRQARANVNEADPVAMMASFDRSPGRTVQDATMRLYEIFPAYFADYWRRQPEFAQLRDSIRCWPEPTADFDGRFDARAALSSITVPTLVLSGAHDFGFPPETAAMLGLAIPDARLETFQQSGHFPHLEEAERFAHLVLEFTRRVPGSVRAAHHRSRDTDR